MRKKIFSGLAQVIIACVITCAISSIIDIKSDYTKSLCSKLMYRDTIYAVNGCVSLNVLNLEDSKNDVVVYLEKDMRPLTYISVVKAGEELHTVKLIHAVDKGSSVCKLVCQTKGKRRVTTRKVDVLLISE